MRNYIQRIKDGEIESNLDDYRAMPEDNKWQGNIFPYNPGGKPELDPVTKALGKFAFDFLLGDVVTILDPEALTEDKLIAAAMMLPPAKVVKLVDKLKDLEKMKDTIDHLGDVSDKVKDSSDKLQDASRGGNKTSISIDELKPLLKTEPDTAFFWSGKTDGVGGANIAADIAHSKDGVTLESTIDSKNIAIPEWDFNNPNSIKAWEDASAAYADQVSGEVRAIVGETLRDGNIWGNVELPKLRLNENVTKITTIDPKKGTETIIFERKK